jgi:hypothetical protein
VVETGVSYIDERKRTISNSRIWVSSGYWRSEEIFIKRNELLDKKYSSLMRYVKKLAPYTEVEVKAQNPLYNGEKYRRKVYITPFLLNKTGEYDCI